MNKKASLISILQCKPLAYAVMDGNTEYPDICGTVKFYGMCEGVIVYAEINGLPETESSIFGFHIHSGTSCTGNMEDSFANAMSHYNPNNNEHPCHAGDMPPLFGSNGKAISIFLTNRFTIEKVIGRAVIIHDSPDDFTTQPSGNSGKKIACGIIQKNI